MLFILDASQSMAERVGSKTLFETEVAAVEQALSKLAPGVSAGVRLYGAKYSTVQRELSCSDSQLLVPLSGSGGLREVFSERAAKIAPRGFSPIAYSVRRAGEDLTGLDGKRIVLFTDGKDTCGGDLRKALLEVGADAQVSLHIIALPGAELSDLKDVVAQNGGEIYDGTDASSFISIAEMAARDVSLPRGLELSDGDGGDAGADKNVAKNVTPGKIIAHIGAGDLADCYRLGVKAGERFFVKVTPLGFSGSDLTLELNSASLPEGMVFNSGRGLGGEVESEVLSFESSDQLYVMISVKAGAALTKYSLELVKLR